MDIRPINQNFPKTSKQKWPFVVISILVTIVVILIAIVSYFMGEKNAKVQNVVTEEKTTQSENNTSKSLPEAPTTNQNAQAETEKPVSISQLPVDFDYELEQLDNQIGSISSTDFSETEMSDVKAGL